MLPPFTIVRPASLTEACATLAGDPDATAYAGGTELIIAMKLGLADYAVLVDLKPLPELAEITLGDGRLRIGATATHRRITHSPEVATAFPALGAALRHIANPRVRNTGTIGGNLAFGEPHSDPATLLVAADAEISCHGADGRSRRVAAADFLQGPFQTCLSPGELITSIDVPRPHPNRSAIGFRRFVLTERAVALAAVRLDTSGDVIVDARVVVGAATPRPVRANAAEQLLIGSPATLDQVSARTVGQAAAEASDIDARDAEADADYLRHLVAVLVEDAVGDAVSALPGPK
jgi:aerobic carbon-monoxide dehydrogenase medium subunit